VEQALKRLEREEPGGCEQGERERRRPRVVRPRGAPCNADEHGRERERTGERQQLLAGAHAREQLRTLVRRPERGGA
jgi:hypothetical protein